MPPKGSKKLNEKRKQIGQLATKRKTVSSLDQTLSELDKEINSLEHRLCRKRARIDKLKDLLGTSERKVTYFPIISVEAVNRRKRNPTKKPWYECQNKAVP